MADIFISYSRDDKEFASQLVSTLEGFGWSVWWDHRIGGGERWDETIEQELDAAKCVIVIWSPESVKSRWVRTEANAALERKLLVPITILGASTPLAFRLVQSTDFSGWNGGLEAAPVKQLKSSLERYLTPGQASTDLPPNYGPGKIRVCALNTPSTGW